MSTPIIRPMQLANQRRSQRILLSVPARISGERTNGTPFVERTKTMIVNAPGALLQLEEPVQEGQALNVRNVTTGQEMPCTVVDVSPGAHGVAEIGVEFAQLSPRFWRVSFPPTDWSTRSPDAKRFAPSPSVRSPPVRDPSVKK
jgi:hypothetical protein